MKNIVFKNLYGFTAAFLLSVVTLILQGQTTNTGEMTQYLFSEFTKCDVLMKNGQIHTTVMNYNIVTGKMVFLSNDKYFDMTNSEAVDTVMLNGCKFIAAGKSFYEVLVAKPIALFIEHKGNVSMAGRPVGYGGTSQVASSSYISSIERSGIQTNLPLPSAYVVNPSTVYWIRRGENWADFTNEKQFLSLFPEKASIIKSFIKGNRIKFDEPDDLIRLVKYCASL
ncbi:MAG: hypothetical protein MUF36_04590 [Bacteroidales bacterium]|jgi:hypothetical protein|nr:hypothetical protein [Bacteroidales bacterium]